jgi:hypothetical protein
MELEISHNEERDSSDGNYNVEYCVHSFIYFLSVLYIVRIERNLAQ